MFGSRFASGWFGRLLPALGVAGGDRVGGKWRPPEEVDETLELEDAEIGLGVDAVCISENLGGGAP